jgi:imidazolonepropionase-like amidohydrolase
MAVLDRVLKGEVPFRIQARTQHDILSAIRLSGEFKIPFVLEEATEAYRCVDELKAGGVGVIFGPIYVDAPGQRAASSEVDRSRLSTMKALVDAGIETALTAQELRDEDGLARQAMYAARYGLDRSQVMRSVTETPARLLGIDQEVGTLQRGKRADIVVWSGAPFDAASSPVVVLAGGRVVLDRREKS